MQCIHLISVFRTVVAACTSSPEGEAEHKGFGLWFPLGYDVSGCMVRIRQVRDISTLAQI